MGLNIIEELLKAKKPKRRIDILMQQHEKNVAYFKRVHPDLGAVLENVKTGPFHIEVTADFLNIIDTRTGQYCHPHNGLLEYTRKLGHWHHDRWVDKLEVLHTVVYGTEHGERQQRFLDELYQRLPFILNYMASGEVKLPRLPDGRRYSGATAFVGIFTGLHILHYLNTTQVHSLILIEPDVPSFCLSAFFLDYAEIEHKYKRLVLHVGADLPEAQLGRLIDAAPVTARAWLRVLPAYPSELHEQIIERLHLRWRAMSEIIVPFDREVRNLQYGLRNLKAGLPLLHRRPRLSPNSRIAVVASGPSLNKELDWLKANQDNLIIISVHSAVKILRQHGIRPDFQCTLDTELDDALLDKLEMLPDVPLVAYYKASETILRRFQTVLMFNEYFKSDPVQFTFALANTHPTSGNVGTALAILAQPARIFLVGLDLGFRDTTQAHAQGYWQGEADTLHDVVQHVRAPANFPESEGQIFTHAYLNSARMAVENILKAEPSIEVLNLADGVRIQGSRPCRSETLVLSEYPEKTDDLRIFQESFTGVPGEQLWRPYSSQGQKMLDTLHDTVHDTFTIKQFDWPKFADSLDHAWRKANERWHMQAPNDKRIEVYYLFFGHLLTEWYRVMLLCRTPKEAEQTYRVVLALLEKALKALEWPAELNLAEQTPEAVL